MDSNESADAQQRLQEAHDLAEQYKEKLFTRFKDYILSVALLANKPPQELPPEIQAQAAAEYDENAIPILLLVDDSETKKLTKLELKEKLTKVFSEQAALVDERIKPEVLLLSELWELCKDAKYDVLQDIALSTPIYDVGMLDAIKLVEVHKQLVLKKFEKYIVAYVLGGSLVQGTATTKSDVDVFIIIDDTDVKKMTRTELRDKLRAIIIDLGAQAGEMTGVQNKINIQVYILTDFWDNIKEANPVIFTFLRDGIPFYDRGIFMPWKQLLEMGKVKPSQEAIDQFMTYGDQYLKRVNVKLKEIGMEDFFWATLTPSQAAIMLEGHPPPTPKEVVSVMKELFVDTKRFSKKQLDNLKYILKVRKDIEHGDKSEISGKEIDELYEKSEEYVQALNKLFEEIQEQKDQENIQHTYENATTLARDALKTQGVDVKESKLTAAFEKELVKAGHVPEKFLRIFTDILDAKKSFDKDDLSRTEAQKVTQQSRELFRYLLDFVQRHQSNTLAASRLRIQHANEDNVGEVIFCKEHAYIIYDVASENKEYQQATRTKENGLKDFTDVTEEVVEQALQQTDDLAPVRVSKQLLDDLADVFGEDLQLLL